MTDAQHPYEDRVRIATPEGVDLDLPLAGLGSRVLGALVDQLIKSVFLVAVVAVFAGLDAIRQGPLGIESGGGQASFVGFAVIAVVVFAVNFFYDTLFEALGGGRTPGKRAAGLRVVRADGGPVSFVTSAIRNFARLADLLPGGYVLGSAVILATKRNQRLGDLAAGTLVVRDRRGDPEPLRARARAQQGAPWLPDAVGPQHATTTWDVTGVSPDDAATIRAFLARAPTLDPQARAGLAAQLAAAVRPKVAGAPPMDDEAFLAAVAAQKAAR